MRRLVNAEVLEHTMKLQQMGAKVSTINSKLCYVDFDLSGFKLQYVYNINKKGNYFLERIQPYPLPLKEFESELDIIELIGIDVEQFKDALKSHHAGEFVDTGRALVTVLKKFEDLYLYYNIPTEPMDCLMAKIKEFEAEIANVKLTAERLYFKKDPDNL